MKYFVNHWIFFGVLLYCTLSIQTANDDKESQIKSMNPKRHKQRQAFQNAANNISSIPSLNHSKQESFSSKLQQPRKSLHKKNGKMAATTPKSIKETTTSASEACICGPGTTYVYSCPCLARHGHLHPPDPFVPPGGTIIYTFNTNLAGSLSIVFEKENIFALSNTYCNFQIGAQKFTDVNDLEDFNAYREPSTAISITGAAYSSACYWDLEYTIYEFGTSGKALQNETGTIISPPDEYGIFLYRPNSLSIHTIALPDDYFIEITLRILDLGYPYQTIHDAESLTNKSNGDFLLIGSGLTPFLGDDVMFFGVAKDNQSILIPKNEAHVLFYSNYHFQQERRGFVIDYTSVFVKPETTTLAPTTDSTLPTPPADMEASFWVSLNGVSQYQDVNNLTETFQETMALMINDYAQTNNITFEEGAAEPSNIEVLQVAQCDVVYCDEECVAFYFRVNLHDSDGNWALDTDDLNDIVHDPGLQKYWKNMSPGCYVCDEVPSVKWGILVGVMVAILGFTVLLVFIFLKIHYESYTDERKLKYEMRLRELIEDKKRKGSDRASILGENVDSRHASLASRRFSMPVPNLGGSDAFMQPFDVQMGGIEDFKTYDPEKEEYPNKTGKADKGFLTKLGFVNAGFANDEVDNKVNRVKTTAVIENVELSNKPKSRKPLEESQDEISLSTASVADSGVNSFVWDSDFKDSPAPKPKKTAWVRFASFEETFGDDGDDSSENSSFRGSSRLQQRRGTQFALPASKILNNHYEDEDEVESAKDHKTIDANFLIEPESKPQKIDELISGKKNEVSFMGDVTSSDSLPLKERVVRFGSFTKSYEGDDDSSEESDHQERRARLQQRRGTQFVSSDIASHIADRLNINDETSKFLNDNDDKDVDEISNEIVQDETQSKDTGLSYEKNASASNEQGPSLSAMNNNSTTDIDTATQDQIELQDITTKAEPKRQASVESLDQSKMPIGEFLSSISEVDDSDADNWSRGYVSVDGDNMSERSFLSTTGDNTV